MTEKATRCAATTKRGTQCKNAAVEGEDYCAQHEDWNEDNAEEKAEDRKNELANLARNRGGDMVETARATDEREMMAASPEFAKFEIAKRVAHTLANSNLVPDAYRGRPNDCFVAINMGAELGMEPFQAIQSIAVIDGKPSIFGDGLIGLVRGSGKVEYIKEWLSDDGKTAYCETKRKGETYPVTGEYSMADAAAAGIDQKKNWKKHPKRMLKMRARAYCLRDAYADVLKGLAAADEMYDHEDTPAPIRDWDIPQEPAPAIEDTSQETESADDQLSAAEEAMRKAKTLADLVRAAELAKGLPEPQAGVARITYKKVRSAILNEMEKR